MSILSHNHVTSFTAYEEDGFSGEYGDEEVKELLSAEFDEVEEVGDAEYEVNASINSMATINILEADTYKFLDLEEHDKIIEISGSEPVVERARNYLEDQLD